MKLLALLGCLAALAAAGCGSKKDETGPGAPERFDLLLDFTPNADHAGIYAAQKNGHFRDVGLDVKIRQPTDAAAPISQVAAGRVDLAISYEPELLRARAKGEDLVAVGALVRAPLTSIVSLPGGGVTSPESLAGKTVGTAGIDYQSAFLKTILQKAGVPEERVKERDLGFSLVPGLVSKKVDAVLGAYWNYEAVELEQKKKSPRVIRIEKAGVPTYDELVFVANGAKLDENRDQIRRFLGALALGTKDLAADPEKGIEGLLQKNRDLDPKLQRASVRVTLPLLKPERGRPFGYQDPREWGAFARWMRENGILRSTADTGGAFTNELLPGRGP